MLSYDPSMDHLEHARWSRAASDGRAPVSFNDAEPMIRAAVAGVGSALLPQFAADAEPALEQDGDRVLARELWLFVHEDKCGLNPVRTVIDWIDRALAAAGLGDGRREATAPQAPCGLID